MSRESGNCQAPSSQSTHSTCLTTGQQGCIELISDWRPCRLDAARPYRAFGYPLTTALAVLGSTLFLAGVAAIDTRNTLYGCVVLLASYPIYRLARKNVSPVPAS